MINLALRTLGTLCNLLLAPLAAMSQPAGA